MITTKKPRNFKPIYDVASCFIEREDGSILLLLRLPHKSEGNKWGVPAGKIEPGESALETVVRETAEETSIVLADAPKLFETYYVRYPEYDFVYNVFHARVPIGTETKTNPAEHQGFRWATPNEALELELVKHQDDCIRFFYF
jgi:mutator protein MutT